MSGFIQLNATTRNGLTFNKKILVDVNKIVSPIIENAGGESIVEVDTDMYYSEEYSGFIEKYTVSQNLAAIDALTTEVFLGTIVKHNNRAPIYPEALFVKSRVVGTVVDNTTSSLFRYKVMAAKTPELYEVSELLATINA